MNTKLFIPQILKVGYNERRDTYSGRLAYVTYLDEKGKHRKKTSWDSWCDDKLPKDDFQNEPMSGFVLNREVGGVRRSWSSWNPRMEKFRVYDPRGFEIEITGPNLLFILQECSSIKGKGLEGDFVYAWDGSDMILLPVTCKEYQESLKHTKLQAKKVSMRDLKEGFIYKMKDGSEMMYLGRHPWFEGDCQGYKYDKARVVMVDPTVDPDSGNEISYKVLSGADNLAGEVSSEAHASYPAHYVRVMKSEHRRVPVGLELRPYTSSGFVYHGHAVIERDGRFLLGSLCSEYLGIYSLGSDERMKVWSFCTFATVEMDANGRVKIERCEEVVEFRRLPSEETQKRVSRLYVTFEEGEAEVVNFKYQFRPTTMTWRYF